MPYQLLALARHLFQYGQVELCMNFVLNWYYVIKAKYTLAFRGPFPFSAHFLRQNDEHCDGNLTEVNGNPLQSISCVCCCQVSVCKQNGSAVPLLQERNSGLSPTFILYFIDCKAKSTLPSGVQFGAFVLTGKNNATYCAIFWGAKQRTLQQNPTDLIIVNGVHRALSALVSVSKRIRFPFLCSQNATDKQKLPTVVWTSPKTHFLG